MALGARLSSTFEKLAAAAERVLRSRGVLFQSTRSGTLLMAVELLERAPRLASDRDRGTVVSWLARTAGALTRVLQDAARHPANP